MVCLISFWNQNVSASETLVLELKHWFIMVYHHFLMSGLMYCIGNVRCKQPSDLLPARTTTTTRDGAGAAPKAATSFKGHRGEFGIFFGATTSIISHYAASQNKIMISRFDFFPMFQRWFAMCPFRWLTWMCWKLIRTDPLDWFITTLNNPRSINLMLGTALED